MLEKCFVGKNKKDVRKKKRRDVEGGKIKIGKYFDRNNY